MTSSCADCKKKHTKTAYKYGLHFLSPLKYILNMTLENDGFKKAGEFRWEKQDTKGTIVFDTEEIRPGCLGTVYYLPNRDRENKQQTKPRPIIIRPITNA
jgi:hypothetical protein